jgi:hypothetical protein
MYLWNDKLLGIKEVFPKEYHSGYEMTSKEITRATRLLIIGSDSATTYINFLQERVKIQLSVVSRLSLFLHNANTLSAFQPYR